MEIIEIYKKKLVDFSEKNYEDISEILNCFNKRSLEEIYEDLIFLKETAGRNYILEEICEYLIINSVSKIERSGMKLGLHRMEVILKLFNNPEKQLKVIHIAGTNGKGSVSSYITTTLSQKYKVGMYSSPGMISFNDRIRINKDFISYYEMYRTYLNVLDVWQQNNPNCDDNLSFFEVLTVVALIYFAKNNVDFVVMEVGLGGRYDGTNVFEKKELSIITKIGLDHTAILGDSIEKIAFEKAGIIKKHDNVVVYDVEDNVKKVIQGVALEKGAELKFLETADIQIEEISDRQSTFSYKQYKNIKIKMLGEHQIYNSSLACMALDNLKARNIIDLSTDEIINGISTTQWPGRLEWIKDNILLDGAHNIDGVTSLVNYLKTIINKKIKILLGILTDKDYKEMIELFESVADDFYITKVPLEMKESSCSLLASCFTKPVEVIEDCNFALNVAVNNLQADEVLVISGSLYLIATLREKLILGENNDIR